MSAVSVLGAGADGRAAFRSCSLSAFPCAAAEVLLQVSPWLAAQAQDFSPLMPRFHTRLHTGFCRIPLLWSFELCSKTGRNFLESFDLISCPMKRKAGVPISCFEARAAAFPPSLQQGCHAPSPALRLQVLSSLISPCFQQCFSTCNT